MKSERFKRRTLYGLSAAAWLVSVGFVTYTVETESLCTRTLLLFSLGIAVSLTTASLFVWFVGPLEHVYRAGVRAGKQQTREPELRLVSGTVIPIRERERISDN